MDTPTRGRNPVSLIMTLPGVQSLAHSYDYRGWNGGGIPGVNGGQQGQIILNMDGAASQDSGNLNTGYINPSIDAIGEVKLLISNYTAEYGGRTAGQLTLTHQERHARSSTAAPTILPPREFERQRVLQQQDQRAEAALPLSESRRHHRRSADHPGHAVQQGAAKALLLLLLRQVVQQHRQQRHLHHAFSVGDRPGDFSKTVTTTGVLIPIFDPNTQTPFPGTLFPPTASARRGRRC